MKPLPDPKSNTNKWKIAHERIQDYLMHETAVRRKTDNVEIKRTLGLLKAYKNSGQQMAQL